MPKYLDPAGVALLWSKIKQIVNKNLVYYSKTTQEWNSDVFLISEQNVLYIYTDYKTIIKNNQEIFIPGLKIGDGKTYLIDLPFIDGNEHDRLIHRDYVDQHPITAITQLTQELSVRPSESLSNMDIQNILNH